MFNRTVVRAAGLLLASAVVSVANSHSATPLASTSAQDEGDDQGPLEQLSELIETDPKKAISQINKVMSEAPAAVRPYLLTLRGIAHLKAGKADAADKDFGEAHRLDPVSEFPGLSRFFSGLEVGDMEQSSKGLDELIAVAPDKARELSLDGVFYYLRTNKADHVDDQRIALAELGYAGLDGVYLVRSAVGLLIERGQVGRASELVDRMKDAGQFQEMLIDRKFEPIWPRIEALSGAAMSKVGQNSIDVAQNDARANPDDVKAKRRLVEAYAALARYDDADKVGSTYAATPEKLKSVDEDGGWLINAHAYALYAAGRKEDAQERFGSLIGAQIDQGWIVSMVINQLELAVRDKRYQDAERMLPVARAQAATNGSDYARQLVRRLDICTLAGLGKPTTQLEDFIKHADDAPTASVEGYMCLDRKADAKALALKTLADEDRVSSALVSLQKKNLISSDPSKWDGYWAALREDPEVEAAFQKAGRDLPEQFLVK